MKTLSLDLRERIMEVYDAGQGTREEIAGRFRVSLGMVKKLLQQRSTTNDLGPRHRYSGRSLDCRFTNNGSLPSAENSALILRIKSGDYPLLCEECRVSSPH